MTNVWYVGRYGKRQLSVGDWAQLGVVTTKQNEWSLDNGWSLPESDFTPTQLSILASMDDFQTGQDGPRIKTPSPAITGGSSPFSIYFEKMKAIYDQFKSSLADFQASIDAKTVAPQRLKPIWKSTPNSQAEAVYPGLVAIGDSITAGTYGVQIMPGPYPLSGYSSATFLGASLTKNRWPCTFVPVGISGEQANAGLARFDTDVIAKKPKVVCIEYGSNDMALGRTAAATFADQMEMCKKSWNIGAAVILTTVPPRSTFTTAQMKEALKLNTLWRNYSRTNPRDFALLDFWSILANPMTGLYITGYSDDGVHMNSTGAAAVSKKMDAILSRFFPTPPSTLAANNINDDNLLYNPMFIDTGGGNGAGSSGTVGNGWVSYGSDGTMTIAASLVDRSATDNFGKWQQLSNTVGAAGKITSLIQNLSSGFVVGDILQGSIEFETDSAGWANGAFNLLIICQTTGGAASTSYVGAYSPDAGGITKARPDNGVLQTPPFVVPPNTAQMLFVFQKTDVGTVRLGRAALRKLPTS